MLKYQLKTNITIKNNNKLLRVTNKYNCANFVLDGL